jgi:hypothetical protein
MVGCGSEISGSGGTRGKCRGRPGCGPSRRRTAYPASPTAGATTAVWGYSRAGRIWYVTQVAASSTTACAGAEELSWAEASSSSSPPSTARNRSCPRSSRRLVVRAQTFAAIAIEHACGLVATFDPTEVRTLIHVAVCEQGADKRIRWRTAVGDPSGGTEPILGNADHPIPVGSLGRLVADAKRERERRRAVSTQVQHAAFGLVGALERA